MSFSSPELNNSGANHISPELLGTSEFLIPTMPYSDQEISVEEPTASQMEPTQPPPPLVPRTWGKLTSLNPTRENIELMFPKEVYTFGRMNTCDKWFKDPLLSKEHCSISLVPSIISNQYFKVQIKDLGSMNGTYVNGTLLVPNRACELANGDYIQFTKFNPLKNKKFDDKWFVFNSIEVDSEEELSQQDQIQQLEQLAQTKQLIKYNIKRELGAGHFSKVYLATRSNDQAKFAVKKYSKAQLSIHNFNEEYKNREIAILKKISHPFVISCLDDYETSTAFNIVLDFCPGGDLFMMLSKGRIEERKLIRISYQLFSAVKYLHENQIIHRDIKPENVLVLCPRTERVKLADFGLARFFLGRTTFSSLVGSPQYAAPEVNTFSDTRVYTKACDLWGLGVMLFVGASGFMPFGRVLTRQVALEDTAALFSNPVWDTVSSKMKHLIEALLVYIPRGRITAERALTNLLFKSNVAIIQDLIDAEKDFEPKPDSFPSDLDHHFRFPSIRPGSIRNS